MPRRTSAVWNRLCKEADQHFGIREFRTGQQEVCRAALEGRDSLCIMPTGAGKSLCYQLPALVLPKAAVVVSPLISLMKDQVQHLAEADVAGAKIDSTMSTAEKRSTMDAIRAGANDVIYVTPERLENDDYLDMLKTRGVSLFVVDEAHCLSQWGHDFRPAYLALARAIRRLGRPPIMALTATATPDVAADIVERLHMKKPILINTGIERPNLVYEVKRTVNREAKLAALVDCLEREKGMGILYVATTKKVDELRDWLCAAGYSAGAYHGKMRPKDREDAQNRFMNDEYKVLVATKAFGMGIDKPNIRFVMHWNFPDSPESYYQEAGRAGRDGKKARAILLYRLEDKRIQSYFLGGKYPRRSESRLVYEVIKAMHLGGADIMFTTVVAACQLPVKRVRVILAHLEHLEIIERKVGRVLCLRDFADEGEFDAFLTEYEERGAKDRQRLSAMMHYAQMTTCREEYLAGYFGEEGSGACGHCDNCKAPQPKKVIRPQTATPVAAPVRTAMLAF